MFAVYGGIAGSRLRKFAYDHLLVNGINEMIPAPPVIPGAEDKYSLCENNYVNRMCHLMHRTRPVIKAAILYHAEAEWYQGKFQRFQTPGGELARHQISYDVIPADVFADREFYRTETEEGLTVNGNRYEALVIPAGDAISDMVIAFLEEAEKSAFPVFYCDDAPKVNALTGEKVRNLYGKVVPLHCIADELDRVIHRDFALHTYNPDIRYAHFTGEEGEFYFVFNEGKDAEVDIELPWKMMKKDSNIVANADAISNGNEIYYIDVMRQKVRKLRTDNGTAGASVHLFLDEWQSGMLHIPASGTAYAESLEVNVRKYGEIFAQKNGETSIQRKEENAKLKVCERRNVDFSVQEVLDDFSIEELRTNWNITLENGTVFYTNKLININGAAYAPKYTGKVIYETETEWEQIPAFLYLGAVYEICDVYLNGKFAGTAQNTPYCFAIGEFAVTGRNHIRIEVQTGTARDTDRPDSASFGRSMSADVYNALEPGGILGPVVMCYRKGSLFA